MFDCVCSLAAKAASLSLRCATVLIMGVWVNAFLKVLIPHSFHPPGKLILPVVRGWVGWVDYSFAVDVVRRELLEIMSSVKRLH